MFPGSFLRYFLLFVMCLILLVATCGYSAPTKVVKFRQRPLLEMLNEHFHTFGRPRFGKRLHSSHDWMYSLPPQEINDELGIENFEPSHGNPLLDPVSPEYFVDTNDDSPLEAQKSGLLRSLHLDYK